MSSGLELNGVREATRAPAARRVRRVTPPGRSGWERTYRNAVVAADVAALLITVLVGHLLDLGTYVWQLDWTASPVLGFAVAILSAVVLFVTGSWNQQVLGQGSEEFARLLRACVTTSVVLALLGLALDVTALRPWVFGLVPLSGALALLGRFFLRKVLHRRRANGTCLHPMLAVGTAESVANLIQRTRNDPHNGWVVAGVCTPTGAGIDEASHVEDVPVLGDLDSVARQVANARFRVVAVGSTPGWSAVRLRRLAWDLEGHGVDLVVDPGLMEMAGPRLHVAPVDGLPLLRLTHPVFEGISRVVKSAIDAIGSVLLLLFLSPVLITLALATLTDGGPVFFRQERIGRNGKPFMMVKFRSMIVDAEQQLAGLLAQNDAAGPLFKLRSDPRVTRVGAVMRKYSLDELPQLFNVLAGSMSLVGPRPPLPEEVLAYTPDAERKLRVKPGLTGLWQVSGRSDLSWEESIRLDLRYVENWTLAMDVLILWKTIGAIKSSRGAY